MKLINFWRTFQSHDKYRAINEEVDGKCNNVDKTSPTFLQPGQNLIQIYEN